MEIVKARKIWGNEKHPKYSEKKREEKGTGSLLETRTLRGAARLKNEHPKWPWVGLLFSLIYLFLCFWSSSVRGFCFPQFCDVAKLAIIHKKI
jgi:hypothetical protein